jgi:hypothetical protein
VRDFVLIGGFLDKASSARATEAGKVWKRARAALLSDPDAVLPPVAVR